MGQGSDLKAVAIAMVVALTWPTHTGHVFAGSPTEGASQNTKSALKENLIEKYLRNCEGKAQNDASCAKLRTDAIEAVRNALHTLGSTANRTYLPDIFPIFENEEPVLRIAAADAIGMIGPQDQDAETLASLTNDPVPDVRQAVSNMIRHGKGSALSLLKERTFPIRTGATPDKPANAATFGLPVAPDSVYWFDNSDASVGRLTYIVKSKTDPAQFYKAKAKKGPFPLQEFKETYLYQFQDEDEAMRQAQEAKSKEIEGTQPPDPTNAQAFNEYMQKVASIGAAQGARMYLDSYDPKLVGSPTVYVLEERQIGKRSYPTRYVVVYQDQALRKPGYRLSWMTVPDDAIKTAQATSLAEEKEELANKAESEALKKKEAELDALTKKKDAAEKKQFKKGQEDLEKALGF